MIIYIFTAADMRYPQRLLRKTQLDPTVVTQFHFDRQFGGRRHS